MRSAHATGDKTVRYGTEPLVAVAEVVEEEDTPAASPAPHAEELDRIESEIGEIQQKYVDLEQRRVQLTESSFATDSSLADRTYSGLTAGLAQGLETGMPRQYPSRRSPFVQNQISKGKGRPGTLAGRGGFGVQGN